MWPLTLAVALSGCVLPGITSAMTAALKTGGSGEVLSCSFNGFGPRNEGTVAAPTPTSSFRIDAFEGGDYHLRLCAKGDQARFVALRVLTTAAGNALEGPTVVGACPSNCESCVVALAAFTEYTVSVELAIDAHSTTGTERHMGAETTPAPFVLQLRCPTITAKPVNPADKSRRQPHQPELPAPTKSGTSSSKRWTPGRPRDQVPTWCAKEHRKGTVNLLQPRVWDNQTMLGDDHDDGPEIPWHLYMTYFNRSRIPSKVFTAVDRFASGYTLTVFDDVDCLRFIRRWYGREVARRFQCLSNGAHRADLFRYALLYHRGGVYFDVKTVLRRPLREIFTDRRRAYTALSMVGGTVYQGIIATPPRNPALWRMLQSLLTVELSELDTHYGLITKHAHDVLQNDFHVPMHPGVQDGASGPYQWTLLKEECAEAKSSGCRGSGCIRAVRGRSCSDPDRYGLCCFMFGPTGLAFRTRYPDYPWM